MSCSYAHSFRRGEGRFELPDNIDGGLIAGYDGNAQLFPQCRNRLDGAPVGAGKEDAIRVDVRHLRFDKLNDLRWSDPADIEIGGAEPSPRFDSNTTGF